MLRRALAAPRGTSAGVAFEAGAVANEREVAAFAAGLAFVALGLGFGALLRRHRARARTRVGNLAARDGELVLLELLGGRELLLDLGLERGGALGTRLAGAEGRHPAAARRPLRRAGVGEGERPSGAAAPAKTESLSVRERVSPLETYFVAAVPPGLPSSTPLPSASKPPSLGSTWARSKRSR